MAFWIAFETVAICMFPVEQDTNSSTWQQTFFSLLMIPLSFMERIWCQFRICTLFLWWLELVSGLKFNYGKFKLMGVRIESPEVDVLRCWAVLYLSTYLGLLLCVGQANNALWTPVVECYNKLSTLKNCYLPLSGWITPIKSALLYSSNLFHFSFLVPLNVLKHAFSRVGCSCTPLSGLMYVAIDSSGALCFFSPHFNIRFMLVIEYNFGRMVGVVGMCWYLALGRGLCSSLLGGR